MTTIRVGKRKKFTMIARSTVNDGRLSFRARGILVWLLDKPDDWQTDSERIAEQGQEGRDAVRSALNELTNLGYLRREKCQDIAGKWYTSWMVFEVPTPGNPASANQALENRPSVSQALKEQRLTTDTKNVSSQLVESRKNAVAPTWVRLGMTRKAWTLAGKPETPLTETERAAYYAETGDLGGADE
jgi:hypothetical protein